NGKADPGVAITAVCLTSLRRFGLEVVVHAAVAVVAPAPHDAVMGVSDWDFELDLDADRLELGVELREDALVVVLQHSEAELTALRVVSDDFRFGLTMCTLEGVELLVTLLDEGSTCERIRCRLIVPRVGVVQLLHRVVERYAELERLSRLGGVVVLVVQPVPSTTASTETLGCGCV